MKFALTEEQQALVDSVGRLLGRYAGTRRARELGGDRPRYDAQLTSKLDEAGFLDCSRDPTAGPLAAALIVEACSKAAAVVDVGSRALVVPMLTSDALEGPFALTVEDQVGPLRYAQSARTLLVATRDAVLVVPMAEGSAEPVAARFGYPMGRLVGDVWSRARPLADCSCATMLAWWRVALAAELVGAMRSALDLVIDYVKWRIQFSRPIGSFQALQHRLAEAAMLLEGSRWLMLEAAWTESAEAAAAALTHAVTTARRVFLETHQMSGAIGFTTELDLHLWTMRLPALIQETEWMGSPGASLCAERWGPSVR